MKSLCIAIFGILLFVNSSSAAVIYVSSNGTGCGTGGTTFSRIQNAINAAADGDTIIICKQATPYLEKMVVDKSLNIYGEVAGILIASPDGNDVINIMSNYVNITNLTVMYATKNYNGRFKSGGAGFRISGNHTAIWNTLSVGNYNGFYLNSSFNSILTSNTAYNDVNCFYFDSSYNNTLKNNSASNSQSPFYLDSSANNILKNNTAHDNAGSGFDFFLSSNNTLTDNIAYNNNRSGFDLYYSSSGNSLTNNTANNNGNNGFELYTDNNTLYNNIAYNNQNDGFYFDSSSNNIITNNSAYNNSNYGFYLLFRSENNTLVSNTGHNNSKGGFYFESGSNILINNTPNENTYLPQLGGAVISMLGGVGLMFIVCGGLFILIVIAIGALLRKRMG